ncbi:dTDP-4-dehydrorhamnose 3,5-epimerase [Paracoccus sp. MC1862]|uniref:dTDP-4-dehydrorhamnose 3,5-epimerase n=1 Tax=Paracoccus sp. MC1862 TaxID=2760307 RepID=UPI001601C231|nr:dTDP-4-dehydrorhamnose 3,5-epimerase [Paracoccus sp. MC1862]MBB1498949.1 dTDP-4-dehydrorhamnose 3,5-epimerase [Paracoccus sp. MC1862]QQO46749.1 dTDP-4-dehydrorhamnose 3,5-epimerase [Paracoccus sp. MC1862]
MRVEETALPGVLVLTPARFGDARGFFSESWNRRTLDEAGVHLPEFVQDNHSLSARAGTLRGLHYQAPPHAQGKLVRCGRGALYDVAVDGRKGSATYGQWVGAELSFENGCQLWVPPGFLHGFVTRTDDTEVVYKCTGYYDRAADGAVRWDSLGIDWGVAEPILSEKDRAAVPFAQWQSPFEA